MIRNSNTDFRMNPNSDRPYCCLPDHSQHLDSLSCRRQSFRRMSWKSVGDCMRNANKIPWTPVFNGDRIGKVIRNPYPGPDHHLKLIVLPIGRRSHSTSMKLADYFCSNRAQRQNNNDEGHSVERMYLRQRCFDGSFTGSVNKTIVKPRVAAATNTYTSDFPDVKFRVPALTR